MCLVDIKPTVLHNTTKASLRKRLTVKAVDNTTNDIVKNDKLVMNINKKFELMLTRRAKAYSSSASIV